MLDVRRSRGGARGGSRPTPGSAIPGPAALALIAGLAALSGCAAPKPPEPPPPPAPKLGPEQTDGIYRGTSTRYQADSRACPSPGLVVLRVVNAMFQYRWNGRTFVDATISPEGEVQGASGSISLAGRLTGTRLEGDISNETCAYHFRAVKRPR